MEADTGSVGWMLGGNDVGGVAAGSGRLYWFWAEGGGEAGGGEGPRRCEPSRAESRDRDRDSRRGYARRFVFIFSLSLSFFFSTNTVQNTIRERVWKTFSQTLPLWLWFFNIGRKQPRWPYFSLPLPEFIHDLSYRGFNFKFQVSGKKYPASFPSPFFFFFLISLYCSFERLLSLSKKKNYQAENYHSERCKQSTHIGRERSRLILKARG